MKIGPLRRRPFRRMQNGFRWSISTFWRKLAKKFRRLDPDGRLGLLLSYFPGTKRYYFGFRYTPSDEWIQAKFDVLAIRGGREIDSSDPRNAWLVELVKMTPGHLSGTALMVEPGTSVESACKTGTVDQRLLAEVSETLCYRMEAQGAGSRRSTVERGSNYRQRRPPVP